MLPFDGPGPVETRRRDTDDRLRSPQARDTTYGEVFFRQHPVALDLYRERRPTRAATEMQDRPGVTRQ